MATAQLRYVGPIPTSHDYSIPLKPVTTSIDSSKLDDAAYQPNVEQLLKRLPIEVFKETSDIGGTYLHLNYKLTAPVQSWAVLAKEPIVGLVETENGFDSLTEIIDAMPAGPDAHEVAFFNLEPDTKYYYAILPQIMNGYGEAGVVQHHRTFTTKKRDVTIELYRVDVLDDSDDLSDGDLRFAFQLASENYAIGTVNDPIDLLGAASYPASEGFTVIGSDESKDLEIFFSAHDVGDAVKLALSCVDDDDDSSEVEFWKWLLTGLPPYFGVDDTIYDFSSTSFFGIADDDCFETNSQVFKLDIDGKTFETVAPTFAENEQFTFNTGLKVNENDTSCLEYVIQVKVSVSYSFDD
jgi:hypothetical protein